MGMYKFFPLLILSVLFLGSCNETGEWDLHHAKQTAVPVYEPVPADFIPRTLTVLSAGDSLTQGVGDSTGKGGYLPYLETWGDWLYYDMPCTKDGGFQHIVFGSQNNQQL